MKIIAFVDVHGNLHELKEIAEKAKHEKVDALICAGDLTFFGTALDELIKKLNIGLPLLIIPGNHEFPEDIKGAAKKHNFVKNFHATTFTLASWMIFGLGGSKITPFSTPFEMDEKLIEKKLSKFKKKKTEKLILVTHEPPLNTGLDSVDGMHLGSSAIRKFIEKNQPAYCICGHYHENAGKEDKIGKTTIINPGASGKIIEV